MLIPSPRRTTVCVSTQAGCARGCIFCLTATMGLERGLTAGEIVGQVLLATRDALAAHLPSGFALGATHITLSTVGTTPDAILATRDLPVQLAWSLHAVDNALRLRLVPTMRHSTEALRQAFLDRLSETGGSLFVEMTLMDGVNDALHHADELIAFLAPFSPSVRVNLLPMNAGREGLRASPEPRVVAFRQRFRDRGLFCAIRRPRGVEASAACGQLVIG